MLQVDPHAFAESWAAAWRRREIDSVVAYYAEDCEFISPNAIPLTGRARIKGRAALAAYWHEARENLKRVEIDVDHVVWDERTKTLVVIYDSVFDDLAGRAAEAMQFNDDGKIERGEAFFGAPIRAVD